MSVLVFIFIIDFTCEAMTKGPSYYHLMKKAPVFYLLFMFSHLIGEGQQFERLNVFYPVSDGRIRFADLDNDNDLDVLYCGRDGNNQLTAVYRNDAGTFVLIPTNLPDVRNGSFAFADVDLDGDLDVVMSGLVTISSTAETTLYENNGGFDFTAKQSLPGLMNSSVSWADIDNDHDLDLVLTGSDPELLDANIFVYLNNAGTLAPFTSGLPEGLQNGMDWADANGDGWIDLILTGFGPPPSFPSSGLYLNNKGNGFVKDQLSLLRDMANGDVKFGDFDNDGDMDLLLCGNDEEYRTELYKNEGGKFIEHLPLFAVGENFQGGTAWIDFDNDGDLDAFLSGATNGALVFKVFRNDFGQFTDAGFSELAGMTNASIDFGDYDNDGDIDIAFMGVGSLGTGIGGIYKNNARDAAAVSNTAPSPPSSSSFFESHFFRKGFRLTWGNGSDTETPPSGLSYNFYLRDDSREIIVPNSDFTSGFLRSQNPENGNGENGYAFDVGEGNLTWAVQSVDGGKMGSLFSSERTFYQLNGPDAVKTQIVDPTHVNVVWNDNSDLETSYRVEFSTSEASGYGVVGSTAANTEMFTHSYSFATETWYYYRVYASNSTKDSGYDSLKVLIPEAPSGLHAMFAHAAVVRLSWNDNSDYETGYLIQRRVSGVGPFSDVALVGATPLVFDDHTVSEGTQYDYRIMAVNEFGNSVPSNTLNLQTNWRPVGSDFSLSLL